MAHGTRKDSKSLPVEETLDKPFPFPIQESGNQICLVSSPGRVSQDSPKWVVYAHDGLDKVIKLMGNVPIAAVFTYLFAATMEILKIVFIQKDKSRERNEMEKKVEDIKCIVKEMEDDKRKLEEQIKKARENLYMISHKESMEWEMSLITVKGLVVRFGAEIACLQKRVDRLESGARTTIYWIYVQFATGIVVTGMLCCWIYIRDVQTGTTVNVIMAGCLLGVATHCIREAQVLYDSYTLVKGCGHAKNELEKPMMACLMCKHAVEDALPKKKKILRVVNHKILKCKTD